jgi:hypothetical protein
MRDWTWTFFIIVWFLYGLLDIIDFSLKMGDKNQVIIEKKESKKEPKKETNEIKADW